MVILGINYSNKPFIENPTLQKFDLINELFFYCILCLSFAFTPFNPDANARLAIGNTCNYLVIILILINISYVVLLQILHMYKLTKRRFLHRRERAARKRQRERIEKARREFALKNE